MSATSYLENLHLAWYGDDLLRTLQRDYELHWMENPGEPIFDRRSGMVTDYLTRAGAPQEYIDGLLEHMSKTSPYHLDKSVLAHYSRLESPLFVGTIHNARNLAEKAIQHIASQNEGEPSRVVLARMQNVAFGSSPSPIFNASAVRVPDSEEYIVLINRGLPNFLARIARVVLRTGASVPIAAFESLDFDTDSWTSAYWELLRDVLQDAQNAYLIENFAAAVGDYFGLSHPFRYDHQRFASAERLYAEAVTVGAEVFVVGHEYGHALDSHKLQFCDVTRRGGASRVGPMEIVEWQHQAETAADVCGMSAVQAAVNTNSDALPEAYWSWFSRGPQHFLSCGRLLEFVESQLDFECDLPDTHPPVNERIGLLAALSPESHFIGFARYELVFSALQQAAIPHLLDRA